MLKILSTIFTYLITSSVFLSTTVLAHEGEVHEEATAVANTLEDTLRMQSITVVVIASILILGATALAILVKHLGETFKKSLFLLIVIPTLASTVFLAGSTIYLNIISSSGGPVHWHAQFEVWDCENQLELNDPQGISNRVGSPTLHEHNDGWIHLEGVVVEEKEASLGNFINVIGGNITNDSYQFPTHEGLIVRNSGDACPDGDKGAMQVFVYKTENGVFTQKKIGNPASYIISPHGSVPPGDCIIIEFGEEKERTDKLCDQYEVQILKGNLTSGDPINLNDTDQHIEDGHEHTEEEDHGN